MLSISSFYSLRRSYKVIFFVVIDLILLFASAICALGLRVDALEAKEYISGLIQITLVISPFIIFAFFRLGLYKTVIRFLNFSVFILIASGAFLGAVTMVIVAFYLDIFLPRSIPILFALLAFIFITGVRLLVCFSPLGTTNKNGERVIIFGAGNSGCQIATALQQTSDFQPVAFVDDNVNLQHTLIKGLNVYSRNDIPWLIQKFKVNKILLAFPSLSRKKRQAVINELEPYRIKVLTLPSMFDLVSGKKRIYDINDIDIDDLLGRESVTPDAGNMAENISNKVVMVTGAGGSIGTELCLQIAQYSPKELIIFDVSEFALYSVKQHLEKNCHATNIVATLGSVQDVALLTHLIKQYKVQTIYHAAAYKHVPLVEDNVVQGVRNNVFGTLNLAKVAIDNKVETFVLISSDKAVRPTNIMGASKRMAELILQALSGEQNHTRFCMVRFGNVLNSSGSVVPLFRQQIAAGGPLTVTHPQVTRFFMSLTEAAQLVVQAGTLSKGGEVFLLDMGPSVKINDLAKKIINLSGLTLKDNIHPNGDIEIRYTGLRQGEKLYEELLIGDKVCETSHPKIWSEDEHFLPWIELEPLLAKLLVACDEFDEQAIKYLFSLAPTDILFSEEEINRIG